MAPAPLIEQIYEEIKRPRWKLSEELKDFRFWRAIRCELLGSFIHSLVYTGALLEYYFVENCPSPHDTTFRILIKDVINPPSLGGGENYNNGSADAQMMTIHGYKLSNFTRNNNTNHISQQGLVNHTFNFVSTLAPSTTSTFFTDDDKSLVGLSLRLKRNKKIPDEQAVTPPRPSIIAISLINAGMTAVVVQIFGQVSGAHLYPALTIALYAQNYVSIQRAGLYVIFQCLGTLIGIIISKLLFTPNMTFIDGLRAHPFIKLQQGCYTERTDSDLNTFQTFGVIFLTTFAFLLIVLSCLDPKKQMTLCSMSPPSSPASFIPKPPIPLSREGQSYKHELRRDGNSHAKNGTGMQLLFPSHESAYLKQPITTSVFIAKGGYPIYPVMRAICDCTTSLILLKRRLASSNIAYTLALAILNNDWTIYWSWWLASLLGALMGSFTYELTATQSGSDTLLSNFKRSFRRDNSTNLRRGPIRQLPDCSIAARTISAATELTMVGSPPNNSATTILQSSELLSNYRIHSPQHSTNVVVKNSHRIYSDDSNMPIFLSDYSPDKFCHSQQNTVSTFTDTIRKQLGENISRGYRNHQQPTLLGLGVENRELIETETTNPILMVPIDFNPSITLTR